MKEATSLLFAIALCGATLRAQAPRLAPPAESLLTLEEPGQDVPATLQKIFSNLGGPTTAYSDNWWNVTGPANTVDPGLSEFLALPFTPTANALVSQLRLAIAYGGSGANQIDISINDDDGGVPGGTYLIGPVTVTNLPTGACCKLTIVNFSPGLAVTAGTQYWIVASTPETGLPGNDFYGGWHWIYSTKPVFGVGNLAGWGTEPANHEIAGAVYGTITEASSEAPRLARSNDGVATFERPARDAPATLKKIFSNLGGPTTAYNAIQGWQLFGPTNIVIPGQTAFVALPFTPTSDAHVSQLRAAIIYLGSGANQINLNLYSDASGVPGALLAGPVTVTNLPFQGTCCSLAIADFSPVAVSAGTQYWIVADMPSTGTGSDSWDQWDWVYSTTPIYAENINYFQGFPPWYSHQGNGEVAGAAYGTIP